MFLLKNSNLVSLNLVGKVFANVFFQIEKEIKVPWGKKMEMAVERETPWLDLMKRPWGKLTPPIQCPPPDPDSQPLPLAAFVFKKICLGCVLLQKHLPS